MEKHALAVKYFPHLHSPTKVFAFITFLTRPFAIFVLISLHQNKWYNVLIIVHVFQNSSTRPQSCAIRDWQICFFSCQKFNYLASNKFCQGKIELGNASCNFHHGVSARTLILVQVSHRSGFLLTVNLHKYINTSAVFPQLLMFMPQHFSDADL